MSLAHILGLVFRTSSKVPKRLVSSSSSALFHQIYETTSSSNSRASAVSSASMLDKHIAFVGAGQMAEALAKVTGTKRERERERDG